MSNTTTQKPKSINVSLSKLNVVGIGEIVKPNAEKPFEMLKVNASDSDGAKIQIELYNKVANSFKNQVNVNDVVSFKIYINQNVYKDKVYTKLVASSFEVIAIAAS